MLSECIVSKEYVEFCKEIVEEINDRYEDNGVTAVADVYDDCVYIKVKDKTGLYESVHQLSKSNMKMNLDYNVKYVVRSAAEYFFNENFN